MERECARGWRFRCRVAATLAVVVACLVVGIGGASAAYAEKKSDHCVSPGGIDQNEFFGVSAQIVISFCDKIGAGEPWVPAQRWFVNDTFLVVPDGFVPDGNTPLEDYIAKFSGVKFVIDPGTNQEKTVEFPNDGNLFTGTLNGEVVVSPITLGTLEPLAVGKHVVDVYWEFSAMHCDGIDVVIGADGNCLPAGDTLWIDDLAFKVKRRR
ncbi:MAG TPA: hypothetical protein VH482_19475 [Thermomicrobiales bacterium]|jgi:hypothetical protein